MRGPKIPFDPIEEAYLHGHPNPERNGCPGVEVLRQLAKGQLPVSHPAREHIAHCSPCFQEFRAFQRRAVRQRRRVFITTAVAAGLAITSVVAVRTGMFSRPRTDVASIAHLKRTADLFDEPDILRGSGEPQRPYKTIFLPSAPLELRVILPRFSRPGVYQIAICRDRNEDSAIVKGVGRAVADGPREIVTIMFDLSGVGNGSYWLSTKGEDEAGSYYFPAKITPGA